MSHCSSICPVLYSKWTVGVLVVPALIPTHQPPPPHPSCSLSVTVGVAVLVVSEVLLLTAVSSVCLGVLVTRDANKLLARLLTPYQLLPSCSLSVTVGVAVTVVSGVLLLIAVSSSASGSLSQSAAYSLSISALKFNQPSIASFILVR